MTRAEQLGLDGQADLRLGRWESVLADVGECDVILTDTPFAERTHDGFRSGSDAGLDDVAKTPHRITYQPIGEADIAAFVAAWSERIRWWSITFGDHTSFRRWEAAWDAAGWTTFAPVIWLKRDAPPRFAGDGPQSAAEYLCVARPPRRVRDSASRPGWYDVQTQPSNGVIGCKDVNGLRRILADYTRPGDAIVDPYAGSASVGEACLSLGRRYIGSEMDPETHAKGLARLAKAGPDPVLVDRWREPRRQTVFAFPEQA